MFDQSFLSTRRPAAVATVLALGAIALGMPPAAGAAEPVGLAAAATSAKKASPSAKRQARAKKLAAARRDRLCRARANRNFYSYISFRRCLRKQAPKRKFTPFRPKPPASAPTPPPVTVTTTTPAPPPPAAPKKAKNIILLIGDGMGSTQVNAARQRYYGGAGKLNMEQLPGLGSVSTYAVEENSDQPRYVTDSASAATAWSSGVKTYNNALGKDTRGKIVPTIMEQAKAAGMRTGNVSNSEITDATPAAMVSHVSSRGCQGPDFTARACVRPSGQGATDAPVAEQIARNNVADVLFGGGLRRFEPDDKAVMEGNGYSVLGSFGDPALEVQTASSQQIASRSEFDGLTGSDRRVIGLFNRGNMTIEQFKRQNPGAPEAAEPTVSDMTRKAIDLLKDSKQGRDKGFFLQVEGALIDKRGHSNDASQVLEEMKEFDESVKAARAFAEADGETLVIVTADHENGGFHIVEKGSFTNAESDGPPPNLENNPGAGINPANNSTPPRTGPFPGVRNADRSSGPINGPGTDDPNQPSGFGTGGTGSRDTNNFAPATFRTPDDPAGVLDGSTQASLWLSFLSGNHTGQAVPIFTFGPQFTSFANSQDNTDIYGRMKSALQTQLP